MSDWSNFTKIKSSSGNILKPEDGKPYKIRIIGEPWVYTSEYQGNLSTRFALTIYNESELQAQILLLSKTAFGGIFELKESDDWGNPEDYTITMKRTGKEMETRYSFVPSSKKPFDLDKKAEVDSINLGEILAKLPSIQQYFPISKFEPESLKNEQYQDTVITDIPNEINMDDIPFE